MAVINFARREIEVKIVYYGAAFSGKTTNVEILHRLMPASQKGELHSLRTQQDRTIFFDYFPVQLGEISGFKARFKLFTVPGQVYYKQTRRVVLQGADAVVFIADSTPSRAAANLESLIDLEENLQSHGLDLASIPLVVQANKRDATGALAIAAMAVDLNPFGVPFVEAMANEGRGVLETLRRITEITGQRIRDNLAGHATAVHLERVERETAEEDASVVREHLERIRKVRPGEDRQINALRASGAVRADDVDAFLSEHVDRDVRGYSVGRSDPERTPVGGLPRPDLDHAAPDDAGLDDAGPDPAGPDDTDPHPPSPALEEAPVAPWLAPRPTAPLPVTARGGAPAVAAPAPRADAPGRALSAWLPADAGVVCELAIAPPARDGSPRLRVVLESGGVRRLHDVSLSPRPREPEGQPRWVTATAAASIAGGLGILLGLCIGWLAFAMGTG